jgi:hypothetical protein
VYAEPSQGRAAPTLFRGLFILFTTLVLAAAAYAAWIVVRYWDATGV